MPTCLTCGYYGCADIRHERDDYSVKPVTIERALKLATPQQLASALASRTSEKKARTSAENGKKGGRPKKAASEVMRPVR